MRISIQIKIVLIYLCTILMIMLVSGTYIVYETEQRDYQNIQNRVEVLAENIENSGDYELDNPTYNLGNGYRTYILSPKGRVITATDGTGGGTVMDASVIIEAMATHQKVTTPLHHFSVLRSERLVIEHVRPIRNKVTGNVEKMIYIRASTEEMYENMLSIVRTIIVGLILAMVITGVCGILFSDMITAPIKTLTNQSKRLAAGGIIKKIPVEATDEIGELTQSFNYMASQLSITMANMTREKNKLEKIFQNMADGVMAFNRQGVLIHTNAACYGMLGKERLGPNFEVIFDKLEMQVDFEKFLVGAVEEKGEHLIVVDDKIITFQFDAYLNAQGEPDGLVVVLQDVTKQQKLDQMRKEFVANVSHELRTPLTTVKLYTETLLDGALEDEANARHFLGIMEKEADRMAALVQDLLELSRIDNKQIQLSFKVLNMEEILEEVIEAQEVHMINKEQKFSVTYDKEQFYYIRGDVLRVRQILHNIFSNAIKYTDEKGSIHVEMKLQGEKVRITVADTGMGIPKEDIKRIFERFYRVDKARSRKLGGTGLGLSIAKELMKLHGGTIEIESEVGKGTTVFLEFPMLKDNVDVKVM